MKFQVSTTKTITLMAVMAALANILSIPPFVIPIAFGSFNSSIHLTQLPILINGILAGPWIGLITGAIGGLYMSFSVEIPFIAGGLAILGLTSGFLANKIGKTHILSYSSMGYTSSLRFGYRLRLVHFF